MLVCLLVFPEIKYQLSKLKINTHPNHSSIRSWNFFVWLGFFCRNQNKSTFYLLVHIFHRKHICNGREYLWIHKGLCCTLQYFIYPAFTNKRANTFSFSTSDCSVCLYKSVINPKSLKVPSLCWVTLLIEFIIPEKSDLATKIQQIVKMQVFQT